MLMDEQIYFQLFLGDLNKPVMLAGRATASQIHFSTQEIDLIAQTWEICRSENVIQKTFLLFFHKNQDVKESLFGFKDSMDELPQNRTFAHHVTIVDCVINQVVVELSHAGLNFEEKIRPILLGLGQKHSHMPVTDRIKPIYFTMFGQLLVQIIIDLWSSEAILTNSLRLENLAFLGIAWRKLIIFITNTLKEGYTTEQSHMAPSHKKRKDLGRIIFVSVVLVLILVGVIMLVIHNNSQGNRRR